MSNASATTGVMTLCKDCYNFKTMIVTPKNLKGLDIEPVYEIEKVFMNWSGAEQIDTVRATKEITSLIIKWLEGKKGKLVTLTDALDKETFRREGRNQLITELIGEVND